MAMNDHLVVRLKMATEGCRALDGAIYRLQHPDRCAQYGDDREICQSWQVPFYTESIDAALSLKPDDLMISITAWLGQAVVSLRTGSILDKDTIEWRGRSATIPLAICIAVLKRLGI